LDETKKQYRQVATEKDVARREKRRMELQRAKDTAKIAAFTQKQESVMAARKRASEAEREQLTAALEASKLRTRSRVLAVRGCVSE
jgi:hypothetical protein